MGNISFQHWGYPTDKPCEVCGKEGQNQMEPRFGYVVCEKHHTLSPVEISHSKKEN